MAKRGLAGWPPLDACYYAHSTPDAAVAATFPRSSKLFKAPRVLLQVSYICPQRCCITLLQVILDDCSHEEAERLLTQQAV